MSPTVCNCGRGLPSIVRDPASSRSCSARRRAAHRRRAGCAPSSSDVPAPLPYHLRCLKPSPLFTKDEVLAYQLQALQENNRPYIDHGIEILYNFAAFDPWQRSEYFGAKLDLGQFERFRRVLHTQHFKVLLCHSSHQLLSSLQVDSATWKLRVAIVGVPASQQGTFEFTLVRGPGVGGRSVWRTLALREDTTIGDKLFI